MAARATFKASCSLLVAPRRSFHQAARIAQAPPPPSTLASPATPTVTSTPTQPASQSDSQKDTHTQTQTEAVADSPPCSSSTVLVSSLILSRSPIILRQPSEFEQAFFEYNRQLSHALQQPFNKEFYFKKGSAAEKIFELEQANQTKGFQPSQPNDVANSKFKPNANQLSTHSDNDTESATLAPESKPENWVLPRETEADRKNDLQSLERKLDRTLYLLVKSTSASSSTNSSSSSLWSFPRKALDRAKENLHDAAPDAVTSTLGENLDIWLVTNSPIGLYRSGENEKTYFMKGHIIAGNPKLESSKDVQEFRWLTKEEIEELLNKENAREYWQAVEDLLDP